MTHCKCFMDGGKSEVPDHELPVQLLSWRDWCRSGLVQQGQARVHCSLQQRPLLGDQRMPVDLHVHEQLCAV